MKKILTVLLMIAVSLAIVGCQSSQDSADDASTDDENVADTKSPGLFDKPLEDLVSMKTKYTADYTFTASGKTQNMTQVMNLPKFVIVTPEGRSIFDGTNIVSCSQVQGSWMCYTIETEQPISMDFSAIMREGNFTNKLTGSCSKAGENGLQYKIVNDGTESTVCYTKDGILLEMSTPAASMVATKISRSVDETLFIPPAKPQDLKDLIPAEMPN